MRSARPPTEISDPYTGKINPEPARPYRENTIKNNQLLKRK